MRRIALVLILLCFSTGFAVLDMDYSYDINEDNNAEVDLSISDLELQESEAETYQCNCENVFAGYTNNCLKTGSRTVTKYRTYRCTKPEAYTDTIESCRTESYIDESCHSIPIKDCHWTRKSHFGVPIPEWVCEITGYKEICIPVVLSKRVCEIETVTKYRKVGATCMDSYPATESYCIKYKPKYETQCETCTIPASYSYHLKINNQDYTGETNQDSISLTKQIIVEPDSNGKIQINIQDMISGESADIIFYLPSQSQSNYANTNNIFEPDKGDYEETNEGNMSSGIIGFDLDNVDGNIFIGIIGTITAGAAAYYLMIRNKEIDVYEQWYNSQEDQFLLESMVGHNYVKKQAILESPEHRNQRLADAGIPDPLTQTKQEIIETLETYGKKMADETIHNEMINSQNLLSVNGQITSSIIKERIEYTDKFNAYYSELLNNPIIQEIGKEKKRFFDGSKQGLMDSLSHMHTTITYALAGDIAFKVMAPLIPTPAGIVVLVGGTVLLIKNWIDKSKLNNLYTYLYGTESNEYLEKKQQAWTENIDLLVGIGAGLAWDDLLKAESSVVDDFIKSLNDDAIPVSAVDDIVDDVVDDVVDDAAKSLDDSTQINLADQGTNTNNFIKFDDLPKENEKPVSIEIDNKIKNSFNKLNEKWLDEHGVYTKNIVYDTTGELGTSPAAINLEGTLKINVNELDLLSEHPDFIFEHELRHLTTTIDIPDSEIKSVVVQMDIADEMADKMFNSLENSIADSKINLDMNTNPTHKLAHDNIYVDEILGLQEWPIRFQKAENSLKLEFLTRCAYHEIVSGKAILNMEKIIGEEVLKTTKYIDVYNLILSMMRRA